MKSWPLAVIFKSHYKSLTRFGNRHQWFDEILDISSPEWRDTLAYELRNPSSDRLRFVADAFRLGLSLQEVFDLSHIDPWYLEQIQELIHYEDEIKSLNLNQLSPDELLFYKKLGFSDKRLSFLLETTEQHVRELRHQFQIRPVYKRIDSCAAEFPAHSAYFYSTYETYCEAHPSQRPKILILGSGPNRIGQGIEFDYCCVHTVQALREAGYETIMINCNPETVSTDYDILIDCILNH